VARYRVIANAIAPVRSCDDVAYQYQTITNIDFPFDVILTQTNRSTASRLEHTVAVACMC